MNKFNRKVGKGTQTVKRAKKAEKRRQLGLVGKVDVSAVSGARTGKSKRKAERQWRKAQKSAIETGLVSVQDIEMLVAANEDQGGTRHAKALKKKEKKNSPGFKVAKSIRVKSASSSRPIQSVACPDAMLE